MDALDTILLALSGTMALLWLLAPLLVRLTFRHDVEPELTPRVPEEVPDCIIEFVESRVEELAGLGFEDCGRASLPGMRGTSVWFALARNDRDEQMACVSVGIQPVPGGKPRLHVQQVEIVTLWPDGKEVLTSNLAEPVAIDPLPEHDLLQVPEAHDLAFLLRVHEARVGRVGRGRPSNPAWGWELESVQKVLRRTLEHQVARGWLWRDEAQSVYRATLVGAWRMTMRLLFPLSHLGRWRIARRAHGELASLGFQGR